MRKVPAKKRRESSAKLWSVKLHIHVIGDYSRKACVCAISRLSDVSPIVNLNVRDLPTA